METKVFMFIFLILDIVYMKTPVILIPGVGGNQLQVKSKKINNCISYDGKYHPYWVTMKDIIYKECFDEITRLNYNEDGSIQESDTYEIKVLGKGETWSLNKMINFSLPFTTYYHYIIEFLTHKHGYHSGDNLVGLPYDFRVVGHFDGFKEFFHDFKEIIEKASRKHGPILIISHSMGSALTLNALNMMSEDWKEENVYHWISLSGAFGGTKRVAKTYVIGEAFDAPDFISQPSVTRLSLATLTTFLFLWPNKEIYGNNDVLAEINGKNFTIKDKHEFLSYLNIPFNHESVSRKILPNWNNEAPNVALTCIYSVDIPTFSNIIIDGKSTRVEIKDGGDHTVNSKGLEACGELKKLQIKPVETIKLKKVEHRAILKNTNVLFYIEEVLFGSSIEMHHKPNFLTF